MPEKVFLDYAKHDIGTDEVEAVTNVLCSDYLTTGSLSKKFEEEISKIAGAEFVVSCSSGTAALHLVSMALNLGPEDVVVVPSITFVATANAPRLVGAEIVFADVDEKTGIMDIQHFEDALRRAGKKCKAVFLVHLGGQGANLKEIYRLANSKGIFVIEDASHAIGSKYDTLNALTRIGSSKYSDATIFSFHAIKTITTGEGGAVATNSPKIANQLHMLRSNGITRNPSLIQNRDFGVELNKTKPGYYEMLHLGLNYRLSDIHCAIGVAQAKKIQSFINHKSRLIDKYNTLIKKNFTNVTRIKSSPNWTPAWHLCQVLIDFEKLKIGRVELMKNLEKQGIGSQIHYIPVDSQPYYVERYGKQDLPGARSFYKRCLSLPLTTKMTEQDVDNVCVILSELLEEAPKG